MRPKLIVSFLLVAGILITASFFLPWKIIDWGKIQLSPTRTITVTGEAETQERSQMASFTAGVSVINDDKQVAIDEVNQKIATVIEAIKSFGIPDQDVKTQNLSVYQTEEAYYEEEVQKGRPGQWRVSNSITITLRNVDRASDLADLLTSSGATNVSGPNFRVDDTQSAEKSLLEAAIKDAQEKAAVIAQASGAELGKIITVSEGAQSFSLYRPLESSGIGGEAPIEPGSSTISQTVTVIFELK